MTDRKERRLAKRKERKREQKRFKEYNLLFQKIRENGSLDDIEDYQLILNESKRFIVNRPEWETVILNESKLGFDFKTTKGYFVLGIIFSSTQLKLKGISISMPRIAMLSDFCVDDEFYNMIFQLNGEFFGPSITLDHRHNLNIGYCVQKEMMKNQIGVFLEWIIDTMFMQKQAFDIKMQQFRKKLECA